MCVWRTLFVKESIPVYIEMLWGVVVGSSQGQAGVGKKAIAIFNYHQQLL